MVVVSPVGAEAPHPATPVCSATDHACALPSPNGREAIVWRRGPNGMRLAVWSAAINTRSLAVGDDGRSLVEVDPGAIGRDPFPAPNAVVLVFHRPSARPVFVRVRDLTADAGGGTPGSGHRGWLIAYKLDETGFAMILADGRTLQFDPATGRRLPAQASAPPLTSRRAVP